MEYIYITVDNSNPCSQKKKKLLLRYLKNLCDSSGISRTETHISEPSLEVISQKLSVQDVYDGKSIALSNSFS